MHKLILLILFSSTIYANQIESWVESEKEKFKESSMGTYLQDGPISQLISGKPVLICDRNESTQVLECNGALKKRYTISEFIKLITAYDEGRKFQINTTINDINFKNEFVIEDSKVHYVIKSLNETTYSAIPFSELINISNLEAFETLFSKFVDYRFVIDKNWLETGKFFLANDYLTQKEGSRFTKGEYFEGTFDEYGDLEYGTYIYPNGEKYIGEFDRDVRSGNGEYFYESGAIYKGNHHKNEPHGYGKYIFANGDIYEGEFDNGKFTGFAKYTFSKEDFKGYQIHGYFIDGSTKSGTEYDPDGRIVYSGEYRLDQGSFFIREGQGKLFILQDENDTWATYEGSFKNGLPNGSGIYVSKGMVYKGNFIDGTFTGEGRADGPNYYLEGLFDDFTIIEGKQVADDYEYHGKWKNAKYDGKAKLISKNPDGSISLEEYVEFKDGVYVGNIESDPTLFKVTAQKRYALVIGNSNYTSSFGYANLENPVNDAELMTTKLREAGFDVTTISDADEFSFLKSLNNFKKQVTAGGAGTVALFYFSGHGLQVDGVNYLVPTDSKIENEFDLELENISTRRVMNVFEQNTSGTNIVILDACRNNPFAKTFTKNSNTGLVTMNAPTGTYIAYSTAPGSLAADGTGKNSLFTESLARNIVIEGLSIEGVFKNTRRDVANQTNNKQVPWSSSSLIGDFYFIP